jgi:hypothetical protein
MQRKKGSSSKMIEKEEEPRIYAESLRGPCKKEEDMKTQEEYYIDTAPSRRFINQYRK